MDPIHGEPAVSDLLGTVRAYMERHPIIDSVEINSVADTQTPATARNVRPA
jgi:hypothetical protein